MGIQIPNSADVPQTAQYGNGALAKPYACDITIVEAALEGYCVQPTGCQLQAGTSTGTVKISAGVMFYAGTQADVLAQDNVACVSNADATNPKWVLYELDTSQTLQANPGSAAANPIPPAPTSGRVVVGAVLIPANATQVDAAISSGNGNAKILDKRAQRSMIERRYYTPTQVTSSSDGVTNTTATTWNSGTTNLNTLTGSQTVTLTSTAGLLSTNGVLVVTHSSIDYVLTYTAVSGSTITNVTAVGAPNISVANGDAVTRAKVVTSASAGFASTHVGSWLGAFASLSTGSSTPYITQTGTVPGGGATWAQISTASIANSTSNTFVFYQVLFTWTKPTNARMIFADVIGAGQGGGGGRSAVAGGGRGGGGGGGGGGRKRVWLDAADVSSSETVTVGVGGVGGTGGGTGGANGGAASAAGDTSFGAHVVVLGAMTSGLFQAAGGTATTGQGGNNPDSEIVSGAHTSFGNYGANKGGDAVLAGTAVSGTGGYNLPGGGGAGGSISSGNTAFNGGSGGAGSPAASITGGAPGTLGGTLTGGAGTATTKHHQMGAGGGGGVPGASSSINGGTGGAGSAPGGGGGGGGAAISGGTAVGGTGGGGATAAVLIISYP